jgi:hypothetical protein
MHRVQTRPDVRDTRSILHGVMILALASLGTATAQASVISNTPDPLPPGSGYVLTSGLPVCFASVQICATAGTLSNFSNITSTFDAAGQELHFSGVVTATLTNLSNQPEGTVTLTGPVGETILGRTSATQLGTWSTKVTSLDLTGSFDNVGVAVTQDPGNPSLGQTTIAALGQQFLTTSFFDVFVDVALATVPPQAAEVGPLHAELQAVPEPASLALLLLPLAGFVAYRGYRTP